MNRWGYLLAVLALSMYSNEIKADELSGQSSCITGNCLANGWIVSFSNNQNLIVCNNNNCSTDGWEARDANFNVSSGVCKPGGCFSDGWYVRDAFGTVFAEVTCLSRGKIEADCFTVGWETSVLLGGAASSGLTVINLKEDKNYETRCHKNNCRNEGWQTKLLDKGKPIVHEVACKGIQEKDCFDNGWFFQSRIGDDEVNRDN